MVKYVKYLWIINNDKKFYEYNLLAVAIQNLDINGTVQLVMSDFRYHAFCFCFEILHDSDGDNFFTYVGRYLDTDEFEDTGKSEYSKGDQLAIISEMYSQDASRLISLMLGASSGNRKRRKKLILISALKLNFSLAWKHMQGYIRKA